MSEEDLAEFERLRQEKKPNTQILKDLRILLEKVVHVYTYDVDRAKDLFGNAPEEAEMRVLTKEELQRSQEELDSYLSELLGDDKDTDNADDRETREYHQHRKPRRPAM